MSTTTNNATPTKPSLSDKEKLALLRTEYKKKMLELDKVNKIALQLQEELEQKFDEYERMEFQLKEQAQVIKELTQKLDNEREMCEDALIVCRTNQEKIILQEGERKKLDKILAQQEPAVMVTMAELQDANVKLRMKVLELTEENEKVCH